MALPVAVRDPDPGSWPLPLPEELVVRSLLPAVGDESRLALRLTCRALRAASDASLVAMCIDLSEPANNNLETMLTWLPRLRGLCELVVLATNAGLAAFAAAALPRLSQVTGLAVDLVEEEGPAGRYGGLALAAQLSNLKRLEAFSYPAEADFTWGQAGWGLADALARLPALRELGLNDCDITGAMLRRPCDELGAEAWCSLQDLSVAGWSTESIQELAQAPLTRLTTLSLFEVECNPGERLGAVLSGAPWASRLRYLNLTITHPGAPPGLLSDLHLPNLTHLNMRGGARDAEVIATGWCLPKLQSFSSEFGTIGRSAAAALAALPLPALTYLSFCALYKPCAATLAALFNRAAPWLPQLQTLQILCAPEDAASEAWAALAAAPLTSLRQLSLVVANLDAANAAVLGNAPWLRGLTELCMYGLSRGAAAALRQGRGGFAALEAARRTHVRWA